MRYDAFELKLKDSPILTDEEIREYYKDETKDNIKAHYYFDYALTKGNERNSDFKNMIKSYDAHIVFIRSNYNTSRTRRNSWKKTQDWLKKMDKWNKNKMLKIEKKKEENEKKNSYCSECKFIPLINKNAHLKKEDENIIVSDRLYSNYFTLRQKKENLAKKQQVSFTFRPRINNSTLIKNK